jgi:imidazoleglycerol-phosphate dehydratase
MTKPAVSSARSARRERTTRETSVAVSLTVEGSGKAEIATGIGFLDHMLELLAHHARFDLEARAQGDLQVDFHHTVEDVGLVIGECIFEALGDRAGAQRFGYAYVPLDEALARAVVDLSGRPYLHYQIGFTAPRVGDFPTELFEDFFRALADRACLTLHLETLYGRNNHHLIEAAFKAFARALAAAAARSGASTVPSTKGTLVD